MPSMADVNDRGWYPVLCDVFLPARRTDPYGTTLDLDEIHQELWERADHRNLHTVALGTFGERMNVQIKAMLIAQGRIKAPGRSKATVKDPEVWAKEAVDFRGEPCDEGRFICQFCGLDYEVYSYGGTKLVACGPCSELLGLQRGKARWGADRNLIKTQRQARPDESPILERFEAGDHPAWIAEDLGLDREDVKKTLKRAGKKLPRGAVPARSS